MASAHYQAVADAAAGTADRRLGTKRKVRQSAEASLSRTNVVLIFAFQIGYTI
jgi:hypothetical protein